MIITTIDVVRIPSEVSTEGVDSRSSTLAQDAGRLLESARSDFFYQDVFTTTVMPGDNDRQVSMVALSLPFRFYENSTIAWLGGSRFISSESIQKDVTPEDVKQSIG